MWLLESFSRVVVAGPFRSEAAMAKKLGVSQQSVNQQIRKGKAVFNFEGEKVIATRETKFVASGTTAKTKEDLALKLGVSQDAVEKVLRKKTSGFVQTPKGEVKIQRLKPGEKPILPAVRVLWNDDTEKQDFFSFAAAAKELKIDPKTIPTALKAGRDSFVRKSDEKKFTIEIPGEKTRLKPKPLSEEEKAKRAEAKRRRMIRDLYERHACYIPENTTIEEMESYLEIRGPEGLEAITGKKSQPPEEEKVEEPPPKEVEKSSPQPPEEENEEEDWYDWSKGAPDGYEYLGMGLWGEKEEEEEDPDPDPFCDRVYKDNCSCLGSNYDIFFNKNKSNLLKPGEKVEMYVDEETKYRVIVVDADFDEVLNDFTGWKDFVFEDDFCFNTCLSLSKSPKEYIRDFPDLGLLPIYIGRDDSSRRRRDYVWRIKITLPEEESTTTHTPSKSPSAI